MSMPPIGTVDYRYSKDEIPNIMIRTAANCLRKNRRSKMEEFIIVVYESDEQSKNVRAEQFYFQLYFYVMYMTNKV